MAISFEDYINTVLPSFLSNDAGRAYFKAFAEVSKEEFDREEFAREEGMIYECTDDALIYHFNNSSALVSPFENFAQMRNYLKNRWEKLAKRIGSVELLVDELKRFGFPRAKIWTWTDLIQAGVPRAFGGNWTLLPGLTPNGGMRYLAKYPSVQITVQQVNLGPNQPLSVSIGTTGSSATITISLQTDGTGFPLSRPVDILRVLDEAGAGDYMYYNWQGTGFGTATASASITLPTVYHSFFIIDLYAPNAISDPILWNDNTVFTYPYDAGATIIAWKPSTVQIPGFPPNIQGMWGSSKSSIWAKTNFNKDFYYYNGSTWSIIPSNLGTVENVTHIFGTVPSNVMASAFSNSTGMALDPGVGIVSHWTGSSWSRLTFSLSNPTNEWLPQRVWGTSGVAMWVVGAERDTMMNTTGKVYFYNGLTWVNQPIPMGIDNVLGIWGFATNDVWAVGKTTVLHFDGTNWSAVTGPTLGMGETLKCVWGTSSSDLYVAGNKLYHYNGTTWTNIAGVTNIINILGLSSNDIYAFSPAGKSVGNLKSYYHFDGVSWKSYDAPTNIYNGILSWNPFLISSGDMMAGLNELVFSQNSSQVVELTKWTDGVLSSGPVYTDSAVNAVFTDIHGISENYVWATGDKGYVYFYDGASWTKKALPDLTLTMTAVFALDTNNVWFVGRSGTSYKWDGTSFVAYSFGIEAKFFDVWFASQNEGYAVGETGLLARFDGISWSTSTITFPVAPTTPDLMAIDGKSRASLGLKARIAIVGQDTITPSTVQLAFLDEEMGTSNKKNLASMAYATDVKLIEDIGYAIVVGNNLTSNGTICNVSVFAPTFEVYQTISTETIRKMVYFEPNDYWVVEVSTNKVLRYNGNSYTSISLPTADGVYSIWGSNYNKLWIGAIGPTDAQMYRFYPSIVNLSSGATGKLWNDGWNWDGTLLTDKNLMNELRFLIRKYKPSTTSCRYIRIDNKGMLTSSPIGEAYEEDPFGNISGPYLFSYLVP